ncbi:MAG: AMP-binding protein [Acidobacteriota bacterium]
MTDVEARAAALQEAAAVGLSVAFHAAEAPDRPAVQSAFGDRTFGALNANANRLVRVLREAGVGSGDGVALLCRNRPEFCETHSAALRMGARMTPINWHLMPDEVAYIVDDCEAKVLVVDAAFAEAASASAEASSHLRLVLSVGGELDGATPYDDALEGVEGADISDPQLGFGMLYTSGTTGRPKGVFRKPTGTPSPLLLEVRDSAAFNAETDVALVTGPLYHAAPLSLNYAIPVGAGLGCVLMDKWDAAETLRLISEKRVTHSHLVATMFHRLLQLPEEVKTRYDVSSLRWILHGAAPTPAHVKQAMIEWWGPILWEYYAATEGGSYYIGSEEWLTKPGSVGRPVEGTEARLFGEDGEDVAQGEAGTVYFRAPDEGRFSYFKAPEKTDSAYRGDYYTMGDMGYLDEEGYLFLTGRSAETIIAGGVNIYPQEIDDVLNQHQAVYEVCTVGVPNDEWGESVASVIEVHPGVEPSEELRSELLAFCEDNLPAYKRPRQIDFATDLPRMPTGKIQRHKVRARYWEGRDSTI